MIMLVCVCRMCKDYLQRHLSMSQIHVPAGFENFQNFLSTFGKAIIISPSISSKSETADLQICSHQIQHDLWSVGPNVQWKGRKGKTLNTFLTVIPELLGGWYFFHLEFVCVCMFVIMAKCPEDRSSFEYLPSFYNVCLWIDFDNTIASQTYKM